MIKKGQLLVGTESLAYEGILSVGTFEALCDFDTEPLWNDYRATEEEKKRQGKWMDFFDFLKEKSLIKQTEHINIDVYEGTELNVL